MQTPEQVYSGFVLNFKKETAKSLFIAMISARDAEWQARVDKAVDEAVSEARKVAQASEDYRTLQARVDRLEAALKTVQPYFCDPDFHEEYLKRWPMKNRCPTCGLFVADHDAIRAALEGGQG